VGFDSVEQEQAKELQTLNVCLAEIARCRPLHIVLLGDRYGWVPPPDRVRAIAEEAGLESDVAGKSVSALEIEFGLEGDPDGRHRCFFYFREPLNYDRMPDDVVSDYRDESHAAELEALRARIEREMPNRVRRYRAEWDEEGKTVTGLDEWGQAVLEDLWQALDEETRALADLPAPTWQDEQRWLIEQFVDARRLGFVGRTEVVERLLRLVRSPTGRAERWGACVTGASGSGKSALFAHLHGNLETGDVLLLSHAAGVSCRSIQIDALLRRLTEELAQALSIECPVDETSPSRYVEESFAELLRRASETRRVVLLIDALDQFEPTRRAKQLAWLPEPWPDNARFVATTAPGAPSEALERRGAELIPLPALEADEARQMVETVSRRYHCPIAADVLEVLLSKQLPSGTPAAGLPLWLELALEALVLTEADDRVGQMLDTARGLPPDVDALYGWVLERNEGHFPTGWVSGLVNLVAVSRNGLRESDLEVLVPKVARLTAPTAPREAWDGLRFAVLRRAFRAQLAQSSADGGWDFTHARLREATRQRNLRDPQLVQRLHTGVAYHLKSLPASDPLRQTELMVHLIGSEDRLRAAHYYADDLCDMELAGATQALADLVLAGSSQTPNAGLAWVVSLLIEPKLKKTEVAALCRRYNANLLAALENNVPLDARRRIVEATRKAAEESLENDPQNAELRLALATSHQREARLYEEADNQAEADACWRRCYETLCAARDAGATLDPPLAELLERLRGRFCS
jgi:hypothetical protein